MSSSKVVTLGCRLNAFESEIIRTKAEEAGLDGAIVINTCAVTAEAERQARQTIRKARRDNPNAKIIVTGCAAQLAPERYAAMPEVDRVIGNAEKLTVEGLTDDQDLVVSDIMTVAETAPHLLAGFESRTRAFVQVQQGCDHRCTFCIIPFARGPNRSIASERVVRQVQSLVANGYREVVLTGVDVASYGADEGADSATPTLGGLAKKVLGEVPELARLRLTSLDPAVIDDDIYSLLAGEPRFLPHLHLSVQAGDDLVLKRMKRRHLRADIIDVANRARSIRSDVTLGADLIAGFPTETEDMFANTLAIVEDAGLQFLHVFPYSEREGTPAARMPSVPKAVRKERAARLREAGDAALNRYLQGRIGAEVAVLVENKTGGRDEHYAEVRLTRPAPSGQIVRARVVGAEDTKLVGDYSNER